MTFNVKFWGVRGHIAVSLPSHVKYGGNTSCVAVRLDGHLIIFNAGTGIRELGRQIMQENLSDITVLFTHSSWDHITGFPFFVPAFIPQLKLSICAGHLKKYGGIHNILSGQMVGPMFPIPIETMQAKMNFIDFDAGDDLDIVEGVKIRTAPLRHPNGATGYRIEYGGKSLAMVAPTGHVEGEDDPNILGLIKGADLVIYDCTFTAEEFATRSERGNSTWNEGVRLCKLAGAKRMAMFHYSPYHDDAAIEALEKEAQAVWPGVFAARDYMEIEL